MPCASAAAAQTEAAREMTDPASLRQSTERERFLAEVVETADMPFGVGAPDGRLVTFNQAFIDLTGYSREELQQRQFTWVTDLTPIEWRATELARLAEAVRTRQPVRYEKEYLRKDGTRVPIELFVQPVFDAAGTLLHYRCFLTDIRARKQLEQERRQAEEQYRNLFATLIEGFCIIEVLFDDHDKPIDYRFLEVNPTFERQTGLRDVQGKRMRDLAPEHEAYWFELYGKIALTGEPARFINEAKALNRWYDVSAYRVGGPDSRKVAILFNDITERKQAEEARQAILRRFYAILSNMYSGVLLVTDEGRVEFANQALCNMFGLKDAPAALAGLSSRDMLARIKPGYLQPDAAIDRILEILARNEPVRGEEVALQAGKTCVRDFIPLNLDGTSYGRLWLHNDITVRKQMEQKLRRNQQLLQAVIDNSQALIYVKDLNGRIIVANQALGDVVGLPTQDILGKTSREIINDPEAGEAHMANDWQIIATGQPLTMEETTPGHVFLSEKFPLRDAQGRIFGTGGVSTDITERKKNEANLNKLNRTLQALNRSEQIFQRAASESDCLNEICKVIVELCGHAMAWIGTAEMDEGRTVRPVASAGFEEGYLQTLHVTWADTERGRGPTGTAIRTGKPCVCANMCTDPAFAPWREQAIQRGYAASLVLPLLVDAASSADAGSGAGGDGKVLGAITIYSREPDAFTADEVALLSTLAADLTHGIMMLRLRTANQQADREREITVDFLRRMNDAATTTDMVHAATTVFREYSGCEAIGLRLKDGDDYPYFEARGFPEEFVKLENSLCARDADGNVICNSAGYPIQECMCGSVIQGRFDPSKPFFTARGSFWANSTTELLATSTAADRQTRTRNRCNGEGYESVALIALRVGRECLGLLQLNDRRKGRFSREDIALWERLADYLATALAKTRAEELLRKSEEQLRLAHEAAEIEVWDFDPRQGVMQCSPRVKAWWALSPEQPFTYAVWLEHLHPEDRDAAVAEVSRSIDPAGPGRQDMEYRVVPPHGFVRWISVHSQTHFAEVAGQRQAVRIIGAMQDITARKQVEEALAGSRERLELALTSSAMATFEWDIVTNKRIWSDEVHHLMGTTPETFTGKSEEFFQVIHPDDHRAVQAAIARALETTTYENEYRAVWPDGSIHHIAARGRVHHDREGRPVRMAGVCWDMTERKQAEEAVRQAHERLAFAQQAAGAGSWEWDMKTGKLEWSPELFHLFGLDPAKTEASLDVWRETMHPEDRPAVDGNLNAAIREHTKVVNEYRIVLPAGDIRWIRAVGETNYADDGTPVRMAGLCFDITQRKVIEEDVRRNADELARFNRVMVNRELRMIELKKQVNDLCVQLGQNKPYPLDFEKES